MINYRLKDSVVSHFPAIFKGLGCKASVIHMGLDVELHGGVLAVRVAGGRPIDCGQCSRSMVVELAKELVRRRHRVVLVEEACGFGYSFHRQLRELGVEAFVVASESLSGKRKTNRRDANKLLDQLYDFDVNGNRKALRPIRVPSLKEQKSRRLCRMRSQLIKVRNILEAQGRGLLFDFDFHNVPPGWWGPRQWPKLRAKTARARPVADRGCWSITRDYSARSSNASSNWTLKLRRKATTMAAKWPNLGPTTFASLQQEAIDWNRFANRKQIGSYIGCCPSEFSTGNKQKLGSIDRQGNRRMRTLLVEAVWRLKKWNPTWRGFKKFPHVFGAHAMARGATRKRAVVACARLLAIDLWRLQTGRVTLKNLGLKPAQPQ